MLEQGGRVVALQELDMHRKVPLIISGGIRTGAVVGYVTIYRKEVRHFTDRQIVLLRTPVKRSRNAVRDGKD